MALLVEQYVVPDELLPSYEFLLRTKGDLLSAYWPAVKRLAIGSCALAVAVQLIAEGMSSEAEGEVQDVLVHISRTSYTILALPLLVLVYCVW